MAVNADFLGEVGRRWWRGVGVCRELMPGKIEMEARIGRGQHGLIAGTSNGNILWLLSKRKRTWR
jgi:hypothetical protein